MSEEKPTAAFVLSLVGGILILINGLVLAALGAILALFFPAAGILLAALGLVFGIIVLLGAIMLWTQPGQHKTWSIVVLVFSILSLVIGGGFIIGFILGLIGGILGIVWKPSMAAARTCTRCGRQVSLEYNVCPHCGNVFPGAPTAPPSYPMPPPTPPQQ